MIRIHASLEDVLAAPREHPAALIGLRLRREDRPLVP